MIDKQKERMLSAERLAQRYASDTIDLAEEARKHAETVERTLDKGHYDGNIATAEALCAAIDGTARSIEKRIEWIDRAKTIIAAAAPRSGRTAGGALGRAADSWDTAVESAQAARAHKETAQRALGRATDTGPEDENVRLMIEDDREWTRYKAATAERH